MNLPKLKGKIVEKRISRNDLCEIWGLRSLTAVSNKVTGKAPITLEEAKKFSEYADLTDNEKVEIFLS